MYVHHWKFVFKDFRKRNAYLRFLRKLSKNCQVVELLSTTRMLLNG